MDNMKTVIAYAELSKTFEWRRLDIKGRQRGSKHLASTGCIGSEHHSAFKFIQECG